MVPLPTAFSSLNPQSTVGEIAHKLRRIRQVLAEVDAIGVRLRGTDWFNWATAGRTHTVLLAAETGIAEVLITDKGAWLITDEIEAPRLQDEELIGLKDCYGLLVYPWAEPAQREVLVQEMTQGGKILSDRPQMSEFPLPPTLILDKQILLPSEIDRYRQVGRLASQAMTEVLLQVQPDWTEYQLAGAGAAALWSRGLHPTLTLVAGARRLPLYRHAIATGETIGHSAMLVFCARGFGLYANLTRFIYFGLPSAEILRRHDQVRQIEAAALEQSQSGSSLNQIYTTLKQSYEQQGDSEAIRQHHQGGTTGYLAREVVATPHTTDRLEPGMAIAWNPSLPGAKIEDTFVILPGELENLTLDPAWPSIEIHGRDRPLPLIRE